MGRFRGKKLAQVVFLIELPTPNDNIQRDKTCPYIAKLMLLSDQTTKSMCPSLWTFSAGDAFLQELSFLLPRVVAWWYGWALVDLQTILENRPAKTSSVW